MQPTSELEEAALQKYHREFARHAIYQEPADAEVAGDLIELSNARGVLARYKILSGKPGNVRLRKVESA